MNDGVSCMFCVLHFSFREFGRKPYVPPKLIRHSELTLVGDVV